MRAGEQGEDTTQFEARLLAQYGRGGETDKTRAGDILFTQTSETDN